jgi:hypothetical protein
VGAREEGSEEPSAGLNNGASTRLSFDMDCSCSTTEFRHAMRKNFCVHASGRHARETVATYKGSVNADGGSH